MDRLAMFGGQMVIRQPLAKYNSISGEEVSLVRQAVKTMPLSGFLGGNQRGGHYVQRLEELWAHKFKVEHAIACNSATSGLLAACAAARVGPLSTVVTTPFTMSATAAAPRILGSDIVFGEIECGDRAGGWLVQLSHDADIVCRIQTGVTDKADTLIGVFWLNH